jgi:hypothetical protein
MTRLRLYPVPPTRANWSSAGHLEYLDQIAAEAHNDQATLRDLAAGYERIGKIIGAERFAHTGRGRSASAGRGVLRKGACHSPEACVEANPSDLSLQLDQLRIAGEMVETATFEAWRPGWRAGFRSAAAEDSRSDYWQQVMIPMI